MAVGCGKATLDLKAEGGTAGQWDEDGSLSGYEQMIARYNKLLETDPKNITALTEIAYAHMRIGWLRELNARYDFAKRIKDVNLPVHEAARDYAAAEDFIARAKVADSRAPQVIAVESILERLKGHTSRARNIAGALEMDKSSNARVLEACEIRLVQSLQIRDLYRRIVKLAPRNPYYWVELGQFEQNEKDRLLAYNRALEVNPNYALAHTYLAWTKLFWLFSHERNTELTKAAEAAPYMSSWVSFQRLLLYRQVAWWVFLPLIWISLTFNFGSRLVLIAAGFAALVFVCLDIIPAMGDASLILGAVGSVLGYAIGVLQYIVFLDLVRGKSTAWRWHPLWHFCYITTRGLVAPVRALFRVDVEATVPDASHYVVFAELLAIGWFVGEVFPRLARWMA